MNRACSRSRLRNPLPFTPLNLFSTGEQGAWYDPSDITTLFQDDAGTVPVTATGDPVGRMLDKSGNGHHATQATAGSRPIYRNSGGLSWLEFDGVDDFLATASINFTATDKMSAWAGVTKSSDAAATILFELSANINLNNGAFSITAPNSPAANYAARSKGTTLQDLIESPFSAPTTNTIFMTADISGASISGRVDGAAFGPLLASQGTGNYGNYPLYIGRRGGLTLPFTGRIYGLIIRGTLSGASSVLSAESYMATKAGITI